MVGFCYAGNLTMTSLRSWRYCKRTRKKVLAAEPTSERRSSKENGEWDFENISRGFGACFWRLRRQYFTSRAPSLLTLWVILLLSSCHWVNPNWSQQKLLIKSLTREWSSEKDRLCCAGRGDDALLITPPSPCASTKLSNLLKSAKSSCFSTLLWFASNLSLLVEFSSLRLGVVGSLLDGGTLSPV